MHDMHHHTQDKPLRLIDFLPVQRALRATIVDSYRDYDFELEAHCIELNRAQQERILFEPPIM